MCAAERLIISNTAHVSDQFNYYETAKRRRPPNLASGVWPTFIIYDRLLYVYVRKKNHTKGSQTTHNTNTTNRTTNKYCSKTIPVLLGGGEGRGNELQTLYKMYKILRILFETTLCCISALHSSRDVVESDHSSRI